MLKEFDYRFLFYAIKNTLNIPHIYKLYIHNFFNIIFDDPSVLELLCEFFLLLNRQFFTFTLVVIFLIFPSTNKQADVTSSLY